MGMSSANYKRLTFNMFFVFSVSQLQLKKEADKRSKRAVTVGN